jgi:hypothetical protein
VEDPLGLHGLACVAHVHSTYSDGTATVAELVQTTAEVGADCLLLTDHDTLEARRRGEDRAISASGVRRTRGACCSSIATASSVRTAPLLLPQPSSPGRPPARCSLQRAGQSDDLAVGALEQLGRLAAAEQLFSGLGVRENLEELCGRRALRVLEHVEDKLDAVGKLIGLCARRSCAGQRSSVDDDLSVHEGMDAAVVRIGPGLGTEIVFDAPGSIVPVSKVCPSSAVAV